MVFKHWQFVRSATAFGFLLLTATMLAAQVTASSGPLTSVATETAEVTVALREPDVLRVGRPNRFAVRLERSEGAPVSDADVRLTLHKPGISGPKGFVEHPFQTTVRLQEGERSGTYEGIGVVPTPGTWQVTVAVKQRGDQIARSTTKLRARW